MKQISQTIREYTSPTSFIERSLYKSRRDQLIKEAVEHINLLREGTKYRKETPANLAKRVNMNKFLLDDGELSYVLTECKKKNNYSWLYWLVK